LPTTTCILADFADNTLLCASQWERQMMVVEIVEEGSYMLENVTAVLSALVLGIP
jgi:hypothetical protein